MKGQHVEPLGCRPTARWCTCVAERRVGHDASTSAETSTIGRAPRSEQAEPRSEPGAGARLPSVGTSGNNSERSLAITASGVMRPLAAAPPCWTRASTAIGVVLPSSALTTSPPPRRGTSRCRCLGLIQLVQKNVGKRERRVAQLAGLLLASASISAKVDLGPVPVTTLAC